MGRLNKYSSNDVNFYFYRYRQNETDFEYNVKLDKYSKSEQLGYYNNIMFSMLDAPIMRIGKKIKSFENNHNA